MPISDYDGTTYYEIKNISDYDGTTYSPISKVYDNNGTDNNLIYSSEFYLWSGDPATSVLSGRVTASTDDPKWKGKFGDGLIADAVGNISFYAASGYETHGIWQTPIDITNYSKLVFTCVEVPSHSGSRIYLGFSESSTSNRHVGGAKTGIGNELDLGIGTYEVDISGLTGSYYFMYYAKYGGWFRFSEIYLT